MFGNTYESYLRHMHMCPFANRVLNKNRNHQPPQQVICGPAIPALMTVRLPVPGLFPGAPVQLPIQIPLKVTPTNANNKSTPLKKEETKTSNDNRPSTMQSSTSTGSKKNVKDKNVRSSSSSSATPSSSSSSLSINTTSSSSNVVSIKKEVQSAPSTSSVRTLPIFYAATANDNKPKPTTSLVFEHSSFKKATNSIDTAEQKSANTLAAHVVVGSPSAKKSSEKSDQNKKKQDAQKSQTVQTKEKKDAQKSNKKLPVQNSPKKKATPAPFVNPFKFPSPDKVIGFQVRMNDQSSASDKDKPKDDHKNPK